MSDNPKAPDVQMVDPYAAYGGSVAPVAAADGTTKAPAVDPYAAYGGSVMAPSVLPGTSGANIPGAPAVLPGVPNAPTPQGLRPQDQTSTLEDYIDVADDTAADVAVGAAKGAGKTLIGGARLMEKIPGLGYIPDVTNKENRLAPMKWVPSEEKVDDYIKRATGDPNATLETHGAAQKVGEIGESIAELLVGEGEFKALSWGEKAAEVGRIGKLLNEYPRLARIATNAIRASALGGVQNLVKTSGEAPLESLKTALEFGATTGLTEGLATGLTTVSKEAAAKGAVPPLQKFFKMLNSSADAAEAAKAAEFAKKGTQDAADNAADLAADRRQYVNQITQAAKSSTEGLTGTALVDALQSDLDDVHQQLMNNYGDALDHFASHADAAGVKVGGPESSLAKAAQRILDNGAGLPDNLQQAMSNITPGLEPAKDLLQQLAKGEPMTWSEASQLQKLLGKKAYSITDYTNPLKRVYTDLKLAVGDSLAEGAEAADQPQLAKNLRDLRADYASTISDLQDNSVVRALRNKDLDGVAKLLMSRDTIGDNVTTLRNLLDRIGSTHMDDVQNEIFNHVLDKASDMSSGVRDVDPDKLAANFFKIPQEVRDAIWGGDKEIKTFAETMQRLQQSRKLGEIGIDVSKGLQQRAEDTAAAAKASEEAAARLFPMLVRNTNLVGSAGFLVKAAYDFTNGDYEKAQRDIAIAVGVGAAGSALKNRTLQSAVLKTLQFMSEASRNIPEAAGNVISGGAEESATAAAAARKYKVMEPETAELLRKVMKRRGSTPFGTGPELSGMAGNVGGEAEAANAASTGLPAETKVAPNEEEDITDELEKAMAASPAPKANAPKPVVTQSQLDKAIEYQTVLHGSDTAVTSMVKDGEHIGNLVINTSNPKSAQVASSIIIPDLGKPGFGQEMYTSAAHQLFDQNPELQEITQDLTHQPTPEAMRMWLALSKKGLAEPVQTPSGNIYYRMTRKSLGSPADTSLSEKAKSLIDVASKQVGDVENPSTVTDLGDIDKMRKSIRNKTSKP